MSTTEEFKELAEQGYKYGFVTDIEADKVPKGLNEDDHPAHLAMKKDEPDFMLDWRLEAFRHWLKMEEPRWANVHYPPHRLPGHRLLLGPQAEEDGPEEPGRGGSGAAADLREARHPARRSRSCWRAWRWTRSSTASRWRPPTRRSSATLGVIFCSFSEAVREHPELVREVPGLGGAVHRQLLRGPEQRGLLRRLLRLRAQGGALSDGAVDLLPDQRRRDRAVRAHPDRRRRGGLRQLPGGLHGAACATRTSCTPRWWNWSPWTAPRSSTRRCRTGIRATTRAGAGSTTSSPSAARPGREGQDLLDPGGDRLGHHLEVPQLHPAGRRLGRRVLLGGPRPTTASRPTPAPR